MDATSTKKINKEPLAFKDTLGQKDLRNIYIDYSTRKQQNTYFFKYTWNNSPGYITCKAKICLNKLDKTEIISSILSDHNTMRLEITFKKKTQTRGGYTT